MEPKRLFVDLDGTLARFHDEADYLEKMFEADFFRQLKPFENMVTGINQFILDHPEVEVYTITACIDSPHCMRDKNAWLDLQQVNIPQNHRIYTEVGTPKSEYIPGGVTKADFLLDDYNRSLNQFLFDGGSAIKCHNNINQQGLGAHGGSPGNLWVGPMVHTDDTPEMISAELAQHMGLAYDLDKVLASYDNHVQLLTYGEFTTRGKASLQKQGEIYIAKFPLTSGPGYEFSNPLNAIRFLCGNDLFLEHSAKSHDGVTVYAPAFQLQAITTNLYRDPNFNCYLKADRTQFAEDVLTALENSKQAVVGQTQAIYREGVGDLVIHQDMTQMQREIENSNAQGRLLSITWFVPPKIAPIHELDDHIELEDRLFYEHDLDDALLGEVVTSILTPSDLRTPEQTELLTDVWFHHAIPGTLHQFLRLDPSQTIGPNQGSALDSILSIAKRRADALSNSNQMPEPRERGGITQ